MAEIDKQYSSIDWLSLTARSDAHRAYVRLVAYRIISHLEQDGYRAKEVYFGGYKGVKCESLMFGERENHSLLVLRGRLADKVFREEAPLHADASRVDLQVTIRLLEADVMLARKLAERLSEGVEFRGHTYKPKLIVNFAGGSTVYMGGRQQSYLARLYDKGAQDGSAEEGKVWRYEIQCNKEAASKYLRFLNERVSTLDVVIARLVFDKFCDFGIIPLYSPAVPASAMASGVLIRKEDRTLEWLRTSVRPGVQRLIDIGLEESVREALGLYKQGTLFDG
jgi:hypothetical protein